MLKDKTKLVAHKGDSEGVNGPRRQGGPLNSEEGVHGYENGDHRV